MIREGNQNDIGDECLVLELEELFGKGVLIVSNALYSPYEIRKIQH